MKKKISGSVAVLAIAAIMVFNVQLDTTDNTVSSISLANVEVLAYGDDTNKKLDCWNTISSSQKNAMVAEPTHKTYCGDCQATLCRSWYHQSKC